jgi:hypothetical protein
LSYRRRIRDEREKKQYVQAVNTVLKVSREDGTHGGGVEGGTDAAARWGVDRFSRAGGVWRWPRFAVGVLLRVKQG